MKQFRARSAEGSKGRKDGRCHDECVPATWSLLQIQITSTTILEATGIRQCHSLSKGLWFSLVFIYFVKNEVLHADMASTLTEVQSCKPNLAVCLENCVQFSSCLSETKPNPAMVFGQHYERKQTKHTQWSPPDSTWSWTSTLICEDTLLPMQGSKGQGSCPAHSSLAGTAPGMRSTWNRYQCLWRYAQIGVTVHLYFHVTPVASCPGWEHVSECLVTNQLTAGADAADACTEQCTLGFGKHAVKLCQEINSNPSGYCGYRNMDCQKHPALQ